MAFNLPARRLVRIIPNSNVMNIELPKAPLNVRSFAAYSSRFRHGGLLAQFNQAIKQQALKISPYLSRNSCVQPWAGYDSRRMFDIRSTLPTSRCKLIIPGPNEQEDAVPLCRGSGSHRPRRLRQGRSELWRR